MSQLEYLVALISIIVGLSLADLARSVRELVRPDRLVQWHWLPLVWTLIVFLMLLQLWWASFRILQIDAFGQVLAFLPYLSLYLVLYLICTFALPDPDWEPASGAAGGGDSLNLKEFYFSKPHRRWFFGGLVVLTILASVASTAVRALSTESPGGAWAQVRSIGVNVAIAGMLVSLVVSRRWWLHAAATVFVLAAIVFSLAANMPPVG
jgi:hypothetical protein